MPIYEYACQKCGNEVDVLQKMDDPPPTKCEKCGAKNKMVRRVSRTSFVLKGGGWGADLYGSKKSGSSTSSTGADAAAPAKSDSSSSSATPAPASSTASTSTPASPAGSSSSTPPPKTKTEKAKK